MVQRGVVFEGVEAAADHVDEAVVGDAADVVARAGQRLARAPAVGLRVVDLVPADAGALGRGLGGAADQVDAARRARTAAAAPRGRGSGAIAVQRFDAIS